MDHAPVSSQRSGGADRGRGRALRLSRTRPRDGTGGTRRTGMEGHARPVGRRAPDQLVSRYSWLYGIARNVVNATLTKPVDLRIVFFFGGHPPSPNDFKPGAWRRALFLTS